MSRKLLAFLLSELESVRLICKGQKAGQPCGTVIEMPFAQLGMIQSCPACSTPFGVLPTRGVGTFVDGLGPLANALHNLATAQDRVLIEFVLPDKD